MNEFSNNLANEVSFQTKKPTLIVVELTFSLRVYYLQLMYNLHVREDFRNEAELLKAARRSESLPGLLLQLFCSNLREPKWKWSSSNAPVIMRHQCRHTHTHSSCSLSFLTFCSLSFSSLITAAGGRDVNHTESGTFIYLSLFTWPWFWCTDGVFGVFQVRKRENLHGGCSCCAGGSWRGDIHHRLVVCVNSASEHVWYINTSQ